MTSSTPVKAQRPTEGLVLQILAVTKWCLAIQPSPTATALAEALGRDLGKPTKEWQRVLDEHPSSALLDPRGENPQDSPLWRLFEAIPELGPNIFLVSPNAPWSAMLRHVSLMAADDIGELRATNVTLSVGSKFAYHNRMAIARMQLIIRELHPKWEVTELVTGSVHCDGEAQSYLVKMKHGDDEMGVAVVMSESTEIAGELEVEIAVNGSTGDVFVTMNGERISIKRQHGSKKELPIFVPFQAEGIVTLSSIIDPENSDTPKDLFTYSSLVSASDWHRCLVESSCAEKGGSYSFATQ